MKRMRRRPDANGMAQVRAARMLVVHTYDLSTDVDRRKFALDIILRRSIAEMDTDVNTLPAAESKTLRAKDTANVVDFWSAEPRAHGGVVSMFNAHFGSKSLGHLGTEYTDTKYWQQPEIEGVRAKHNRNVLTLALISAMNRSGLLGRATLKHVISLCNLTCVDSTLGWYHVSLNSTAPSFCMHEWTVWRENCVCCV